jgi:hypothetical protein
MKLCFSRPLEHRVLVLIEEISRPKKDFGKPSVYVINPTLLIVAKYDLYLTSS